MRRKQAVAIAVAEMCGERWSRARVLWTLGLDAWMRGDLEAGETLVRTGLEFQRGFNDYFGAALQLELLALVAAAIGDYSRAGRLLGAVRALMEFGGIDACGIGGYLTEHLVRCEETVARALGQTAYDKARADSGRQDGLEQVIAYALGSGTDPVAPATESPLTRREMEVAALVAKGMSNRQIASALGRSPRTVDRHVENVLSKLGFGSRAGIAAWWTANQTHPLEQ